MKVLPGTLQYDDDDLIYEVNPNDDEKLSKYDRLLRAKWEDAADKGYFWYRLDELETRVLPGKYMFVAQLNIRRAQERRKPQHITSVAMPFDPSQFNFTKIKDTEILFRIKRSSSDNTAASKASHYVVINVSPLEYCNALLVPYLEDCLPQVLTGEGLQLAIDTVLLSSSPYLRLGFNSLCGFASVNHHHYHLYYLRQRLYLETAEVRNLGGECHELVDYPAEGFAFEVSAKNRIAVVDEAMKIIRLLIDDSVAHNVFLTRGAPFAGDDGAYSVVRLYLWARKTSYGAKDESAFNVALCELSGHLPMKTEDGFRAVTEGSAAEDLRDFCHDAFVTARSKILSAL